jgi:hypothetical protein
MFAGIAPDFSAYLHIIYARAARGRTRFASLRFAREANTCRKPRFSQDLQDYRDYSPQRNPGNLFHLTEITVRTFTEIQRQTLSPVRESVPQFCGRLSPVRESLPQFCGRLSPVGKCNLPRTSGRAGVVCSIKIKKIINKLKK